MSVAFTREESAETAAEFQLPERPISPHPNLVTPSGLQALEQALAAARAAWDAAQTIEDINERRRAGAAPLRELNYFAERLATAQLIPPASGPEGLAFGGRVTFSRNAGRAQSFRIVGEDEADPKQGTISYVAPLARALMGKAAGDVVGFGDDEIEILKVEP